MNVPRSLPVVEVLDWRDRQPDPPPLVRGTVRKHLVRGGRVVRRNPARVDGIVIHQTACVFGPAADRDRRLARALGVACHALAFREGVVVLPNPLEWHVWHGNGFNDRSLGLEVEGIFPGIEGDARTLWRGPETPVTDLVVETARVALRELVERGRAAGMPIRYVWAHRQSSASRRSDPGSEVWRRVVLDFAVPALGLETEPGLVLPSKEGSGRPIPVEWDPRGVGRY